MKIALIQVALVIQEDSVIEYSCRMKFYHKASDGQCVAAESSGYCRFAPAMAPILALCV